MTAAIKIPPHDARAEVAYLGAVMLDPSVLESSPVRTADMYLPRHQALLAAMQSMRSRGEEIDEVTLWRQVQVDKTVDEVGGAPEIAMLSNSTPTAANAGAYARIIRDMATLRKVLVWSQDVATTCYELADGEAIADTLERFSRDALQIAAGRSNPIRPEMEVVSSLMEQLDAADQKTGLSGASTGVFELDRLTNGLRKGELVILAARPSMGKTAFALSVATRLAEHKVPIGFFSLEMPAEQLALRQTAAASKVDLKTLRSTTCRQPGVTAAMQRLMALPIYFDDSPGLSLSDLRARSRLMAQQYGVQLIMVDYLQLMQVESRHQNREQAVSELSRQIKCLSRELDIPIVLLSQLNRACETRADKRPMLSDLRESGAIEQDADMVLFLYRDCKYNPDADKTAAEVIVAKNRQGPTGTARCRFVPSSAWFEE